MKRRAAIVLAAAAAALTAACGHGIATVATEPPAQRPGITLATATATPVATATPATPVQLDDAADALGEQGRGPYADTWGALTVDAAHGRVLLYATSTGRAEALVAAAREAHPGIARVEVRIVRCEYTRKAELAAVERIFAAQQAKPSPFPFPVYGAGPSTVGSGVTVTAPPEALGSADFLRQLQTAAGPVPVTVEAGGQPVAAVATG